MNLPTLIRRALVSALLMSLAWSLRGQFGHLKGGLIPGAFAVVAAAYCHPLLRNRKAIGRALLLSPLGFSIGGHLSYGKTILAILVASGLSAAQMDLLRIFLLGAVWGGLGFTFLGFAFSEDGLQKRDWGALAAVAASWILFLGIFNLERYDLALLIWSFILIHLYNAIVKKSSAVTVLGIFGALGFGLGFLTAILFLYAGKNGVFGGGWPWWALRDQIIGIFGGLSLYAAVSAIAWKFPPLTSKNPTAVEKWGLISYGVLVPFPNALNVLIYWVEERRMFSKPLLYLGVGILVLLAVVKIFTLVHKKSSYRTLISSTIFLIWILCVLGIAKELVPFGMERWEDAYTLFLCYSAMLTAFLFQESRMLAKEATPSAGSGA